MEKKVLLIAGGGTLGTYVAKELLKKGCLVDIICLEDKVSDDDRMKFFKACADLEYLTDFLSERHYDAIVNFIHYRDIEEYKPIHSLLSSKTEQVVFLSSYRIYADMEHPITENAPTLYDTVTDEMFLKNDSYSVPKTKCEYFIREESGTSNWTIVRPVISFSAMRFDVVTESGLSILERAKGGIPIKLPLEVKNLTAGIDWAGNSGKLIANLLFKKHTLGKAYTVSTAQNNTWEEITDMYTDIIGAKFEWVSMEEYLSTRDDLNENSGILKYDRMFDRCIDNSKILADTGLSDKDFVPIKEAIKIELENLKLKGKMTNESNTCK